MIYILKTYILTLFVGSVIMLIPLSIETPSMLNPDIIFVIPVLIFYSFIASVIPLIINLLLVNFYSSKNKFIYMTGTILTVVTINIIMSLLLDENPYTFLINLTYAIPYILSFSSIIIFKEFKINEY